MNNLQKQIFSFVLGFVLCVTVSVFCCFLISFWMKKNNIIDNWILFSQIIVVITVFYTLGYQGIRKIKPVHTGVPLFFDAIVEWFLLPSGLFWILPEPLMGFIDVSLKEQTKDLPLKKVLSLDNIEAEIDVQVQYIIEKPFVLVKVEEPEKALEGLVDRNVRWLANALHIEKLPGVKSLFSQMLEGKVSLDDLKNHSETKSEQLGDDHPDDIREVARQWGYKIIKAMVTDIVIPEEIVDANIKKQTEKAERVSESTENQTLILLMRELKKEFPNLSDQEVANLVQTERGKVTRHIIDGTADSLTKAGSLAGGNKK